MGLFMWVTDLLEPCNDPTKDGCFITKSYDATSHFETTSVEVLALSKAITGKDIDSASRCRKRLWRTPMPPWPNRRKRIQQLALLSKALGLTSETLLPWKQSSWR